MTTREYNKCVDKYADGVYRFILKNVKDEDAAKDIVQEVFARIWEKVGTISYEKSKSYLFTSAYHTMIDWLRREKRINPLDDQVKEKLTDQNHYSDLKEIIEVAVSKLPDIQRSVLMLRDYEGYSYKEIGEITGLNESQVKVYIYRARVYLKDYIGSLEHVI